MTFISLTRLRLRSIRFLPVFVVYTLRARAQATRAAGFQGGALLLDRSWTFWTMTAWADEASMRAYRNTGSHMAAMPRLLNWCDEASVAHWLQPDTTLPSWLEADKKMREIGRTSKVKHPSPHHEDLSYRPPRTEGGSTIKPV
jgi:Domain of unknown function (DUF3291)